MSRKTAGISTEGMLTLNASNGVAGAVLPWSTRAIYQDCVMRQSMQSTGYPRGQYRGRNTIEGRVDLYNSRFDGGTLIYNGQPYPPR